MVMFDVVEAILLRCVTNDLLRCKSVCKSWCSLIESPSFVKTHVKFVCNKEEGRKIAMITSHKDLPESGDYNETPEKWQPYTRWKIQGSSNGLVLYLGPRLCVTNPVTREFRELQQPPERTPREMQCFGFGYDSSTDDYKVVLAICQPGKTFVRILSLKSNTWNISVGQVNYKFHDGWLEKPGVLSYGALHWFWYDANEKPLIVSFDLAKEEFKEIPQPRDTRYVWNIDCTLGILNGHLCIYPYFDNSTSTRFPSCGTWVMKNYHHLNPSWELLSKDSQMNNHAIHHILNNFTPRSKIMPAYSCDENMELSRSNQYIRSPIFVKTLVSPGGPSHAKDNKSTACPISVKEKRETEEGYSVEVKEEENKSSLVEVGNILESEES